MYVFTCATHAFIHASFKHGIHTLQAFAYLAYLHTYIVATLQCDNHHIMILQPCDITTIKSHRLTLAQPAPLTILASHNLTTSQTHGLTTLKSYNFIKFKSRHLRILQSCNFPIQQPPNLTILPDRTGLKTHRHRDIRAYAHTRTHTRTQMQACTHMNK